MSTGDELRREGFQAIKFDADAFRRPEWGQLGIRALFGGGIALAAGLLGMRFGPLLGGVLLAVPAVLPAALSLLERIDGRDKADVDAVGAVSGSLGMVAFAAVLAFALRGRPGLGLVAAAAAWLVVSLTLFLLIRSGLRAWGYDQSGSRRTGGRRRTA